MKLAFALSVLALPVAANPAGAAAQSAPAACRPLIEAEKKQILTPHHVYVTSGAAGKRETDETITAGGVTYVQTSGAWRRSPMTARDQLDLLERNLATAKTYSCQRVGTEPVGGVSAVVYTAHTENEGVVADSRTWIASGTGLPLRQEEDVDTGFGDKQHMSMRYEYANVHAPAGAK
jgi:hypothetical protein